MVKKKKTNQPVTKTIKVPKNLKVELTREEVEQAGQVLAEKLAEKNRIEIELKAVKSQYKSRIEEVESQINRHRGLVADKFDYRQVQCNEIFNYTDGTVTTIRLDTDEEESVRVMSQEEKQAKFDFGDDNKDGSDSDTQST